MYTSILKLPAYHLYWSKDMANVLCPATDLTPCDLYKKIKSYLHVVDNAMKKTPENKGNRLYKVALVIDHVKKNCNKIETEQYQPTDKQIVPAKTRFSGIRQYNLKKPTK